MQKRASYVSAAFVVALVAPGFIGGSAAAERNPVDEVSNPTAYDYSDVEIAPSEMNEDFIRDGIVTDPTRFANVTRGLDEAEVLALLGAPLDRRGGEWDYNFQLRMKKSENFFVCQYKVVFDEGQRVRETVWRRRQCERLAEAAN